MSSAVGTFSAFRMLPTVVASLVKPFGTPFKVTPKGSGNEDSAFDAYTFTCLAILTGVTALGLFVNIVPEWSPVGQGEFSVVSAYWAAVNIVVLRIATLICFEKSKPLLDSFAADEPVHLATGAPRGRRPADGCPADLHAAGGRMVSVSLDRAEIEVPAEAAPQPGSATLTMDGVPPFEARVDRVDRTIGGPATVWLSYDLSGAARDAMIVKLYTGGYSQDIRVIDKSAVAGGLWNRAFGAAPTANNV